MTFSVLTLNIWNHEGPWGDRLPLIRACIGSLDPDLIALQEVLVGEAKRDGAPWRIGIETPDVGAQHLQRTVPLNDHAMATSGNYRNFYVMGGRTVGHTIDPRDGEPVDHNGASVSVIHESCMMADGMATVLMVMGPEEGYAWAVANDVAAMFVVHDGEGFVERLTPAFAELARVERETEA